jgi:23S rRNA (cytidine1920-2'-O)/16S rRNA (cytidine1409-2'-O)-methyltransferase
LEGQLVLDIGSSTGGFTEVALRRGAKKVVAVDVGRGQLHPKLRGDPRVELFEGTDIREFTYPERFPVILSDVSFISLLKILPAIGRLGAPGGRLLLLFKPQFEVGPEVKRDKRGVVVDSREIERARARFEGEIEKLGWKIEGVYPSPVKGKEGNQEYGYFIQLPPTPQQ